MTMAYMICEVYVEQIRASFFLRINLRSISTCLFAVPLVIMFLRFGSHVDTICGTITTCLFAVLLVIMMLRFGPHVATIWRISSQLPISLLLMVDSLAGLKLTRTGAVACLGVKSDWTVCAYSSSRCSLSRHTRLYFRFTDTLWFVLS